jgi:hypothetical protein
MTSLEISALEERHTGFSGWRTKPEHEPTMGMNAYITAKGEEDLAQIVELYFQYLCSRIEVNTPYGTQQFGSRHY